MRLTLVLLLFLIAMFASTGGGDGVISSRRKMRVRLDRIRLDEHGHIQPTEPNPDDKTESE